MIVDVVQPEIRDFLLLYWIRPEAPSLAAAVRQARALARELGQPELSEAALRRCAAEARRKDPVGFVTVREGERAGSAFAARLARAGTGPAARRLADAMPAQPAGRRK